MCKYQAIFLFFSEEVVVKVCLEPGVTESLVFTATDGVNSATGWLNITVIDPVSDLYILDLT